MRKIRRQLDADSRLRKSRHRLLRMEWLEERLALDSQGVGALVGFDPHFTLSFADDGVAVAGQASALATSFNAVAPEAVWREQILRAFQTWAVQTNADFGVVSDGGQAFGGPGATQGDDRFGDIRVGAIALSPEVGAVSVPVDNFVSGTWLADVLFNTQFGYQSADEILAVAMHEAGNVFGLDDSADPNSPLVTGGQPTVKTPTAADVAALQALYGTRLPDANEALGGNSDNDSFTTAAKLDLWDAPGGDGGTAPTIVYGDIGSASDADYFYIDTPGDYFGPVTFTLRSSGISLLQPDLTIYNAAEQPLDQVMSSEVGGDVLTLQLSSSTPHQRLYVRVAGATPDVFGIGGYSLVTQFDGINLADQARIDLVASGVYRFLPSEELAKFFDGNENELFNDDGHSDDEANLGTELDSLPNFVADSRYETTGSIADATDVDFYNIKSPQVAGNPLNVMTVAVRSLDVAGLIPKLSILDEDQNPLAMEVVVNGGGELVVQVTGVDPNSDYVIGVSADDPGGPFDSGNYRLAVAFTSGPVALEAMATGTVGDAVTSNVHTLYVGQPQLFHLVLEAGTSSATVPSAIIATIKDENSAVVATIAAPPGARRSLPGVFMNAGTYTVEVEVRTLDGSLSPAVSYSLLGTSISDPFVGDPEDPNSHPFACMDPELAGYFCYPGDFISPDPFLWDSFVSSLSNPPPPLDLGPLVDFLLGDWWSWVWAETGVNGPPLAQDDGFEMSLGGSSGGGAAVTLPLGPASNVLTNDIEPEGDPFVAVLQAVTTHGSVVLNPDGTFVYTPEAGFKGTDRFSYVAYDFHQESSIATVRIVVTTGVVGDYNADGIVNESDYLAWKSSFGSIDELLADGNRNGRVDAADYTIWRNNSSAVVAKPGDYNADNLVNEDDYLVWKTTFGSADDLRADGNHSGRVDAADYTVWRNNLSAVVVGAGSAAATTEVSATPVERSPPVGAMNSSIAVPVVDANVPSQLVPLTGLAAPQPAVAPVTAPAASLQTPLAVGNAEAPSLLLAATSRIRHGNCVVSEGVQHGNRQRVFDVAFADWPSQRSWLRKLDVEFFAKARRWLQ
jgi:Bacterial Ig domain/Dockerin type I domain